MPTLDVESPPRLLFDDEGVEFSITEGPAICVFLVSRESIERLATQNATGSRNLLDLFKLVEDQIQLYALKAFLPGQRVVLDRGNMQSTHALKLRCHTSFSS